MPVTNTITFSISPIPTGTAEDANQYAQTIASSLQATLSGNFLTGQIDGTPPTQNIGVWLNQGAWYIWNGTAYVPQTLTTNPSGAIIMFGGSSAPSGYLFCDGSLYLRSSFPTLYSVIGDVYGTNDGVSTFRVPDMRGRSPVGAGTGTGLTARSRGDSYGEETHTLSITELAAHTHGLSTHTHTMGNHTHLGANHQHDLQSHTHLGVNHLHDLQNHSHAGANHLHDLQGHTHGYNTVTFGISGDQLQAQVGGTLIGIAGAGTGGPSPNNTGFADRSLQTGGPSPNNTGAADRDLTTSGPSINNTGFSLQGLTTGGPSTNTTAGPSVDFSTSTGGGAAHNNLQPNLVCNFLIKT